VARKTTHQEPAFGSDSFLDVTANLVGVLIILIVLVGLRVSRTPPREEQLNAESERQLAAMRDDLRRLEVTRLELRRQLERAVESHSAKSVALDGLKATAAAVAPEAARLADMIEQERGELQSHASELVGARARLVSLSRDVDERTGAVAKTRNELHHTPVSRPVELDEIQLELRAGRVAWVDVSVMMDRARAMGKEMEPELRSNGRASREIGPVGPYRLKFTLAREDMPFTQSLFYGAGSFRARLVQWEIVPVQQTRGEPVEAVASDDSQIESVLRRHSPNKFAVTIWTYPDSFTAFRQLRDHLADRGYAVAARPLPAGIPIRGSVYGTRSITQ
jgi:hypothetical protein